jgi:hypothetical protein
MQSMHAAPSLNTVSPTQLLHTLNRPSALYRLIPFCPDLSIIFEKKTQIIILHFSPMPDSGTSSGQPPLQKYGTRLPHDDETQVNADSGDPVAGIIYIIQLIQQPSSLGLEACLKRNVIV